MINGLFWKWNYQNGTHRRKSRELLRIRINWLGSSKQINFSNILGQWQVLNGPKNIVPMIGNFRWCYCFCGCCCCCNSTSIYQRNLIIARLGIIIGMLSLNQSILFASQNPTNLLFISLEWHLIHKFRHFWHGIW